MNNCGQLDYGQVLLKKFTDGGGWDLASDVWLPDVPFGQHLDRVPEIPCVPGDHQAEIRGGLHDGSVIAKDSNRLSVSWWDCL